MNHISYAQKMQGKLKQIVQCLPVVSAEQKISGHNVLFVQHTRAGIDQKLSLAAGHSTESIDWISNGNPMLDADVIGNSPNTAAYECGRTTAMPGGGIGDTMRTTCTVEILCRGVSCLSGSLEPWHRLGIEPVLVAQPRRYLHREQPMDGRVDPQPTSPVMRTVDFLSRRRRG